MQTSSQSYQIPEAGSTVQGEEAALQDGDISQEVSALLDLLPSSSAEQWQQVENGLTDLLLQAHTENASLQQKLARWCAVQYNTARLYLLLRTA